MTACRECGEEIPEPGRFCGICGAPATTANAPVLVGAADPLARTARAVVAPTVNDLVLVPEPGAKVQVEWSDGHKYPGMVKQSSTEQCLVLFPDGQEKWVELRRVSPA